MSDTPLITAKDLAKDSTLFILSPRNEHAVKICRLNRERGQNVPIVRYQVSEEEKSLLVTSHNQEGRNDPKPYIHVIAVNKTLCPRRNGTLLSFGLAEDNDVILEPRLFGEYEYEAEMAMAKSEMKRTEIKERREGERRDIGSLYHQHQCFFGIHRTTDTDPTTETLFLQDETKTTHRTGFNFVDANPPVEGKKITPMSTWNSGDGRAERKYITQSDTANKSINVIFKLGFRDTSAGKHWNYTGASFNLVWAPQAREQAKHAEIIRHLTAKIPTAADAVPARAPKRSLSSSSEASAVAPSPSSSTAPTTARTVAQTRAGQKKLDAEAAAAAEAPKAKAPRTGVLTRAQEEKLKKDTEAADAAKAKGGADAAPSTSDKK